ncbi:MAG: DUF4136 domain-containing protein [Desulfobacterales bacterium]|nr:MAG: DUF4136 domain-containing protein [Desulfobacterales bacterium]
MKSLNAWIVICCVGLAVGCTAPNKTIHHDVTYDYDVNVDFSRFNSYNWVKLPATSRLDPFNQIRIKDAVNTQLEAKGLKVDIDKPDVYLVIYGGSYKAVDMAAMMDYKVYNVGRLKLAMYDAESHQEIWWAETRADLHEPLTPAQKDDVIAIAVQNILKYYPPRP